MAQRMQQHRGPAGSAPAQAWQTNGLPRELNERSSIPATGGLLSTTTLSRSSNPYRSMLASMANAQAYSLNHELPMASPMIMSDADYQGSLHNHFDYSSIQEGQSTVVKNERDYTDGLSWPLSIRQSASLQPVGTAEGSDFDTGTSSLSPRSGYFSEPSERDLTFPPRPRLEEVSANTAWAEYSPESPTQIKQSSSQANSPGFSPQLPYAVIGDMGVGVSASHSAMFGTISWTGPRNDGGFGAQIGQFPIPWAASVHQNESTDAMSWRPSAHPQEQQTMQQPYYPQCFVNPFQRGTTDSGSTVRAGTASQNMEQVRESRRDSYSQDGSIRSTEEQKQRELENKILMDGKAEGLTYKEIKARMKTDVAESTLRGRWRALTKLRKDRVRKPVWTPKDIRLLKEVVAQQLDSLDDGYRSTNPEHRLTKVSWKKVRDYIAENGGSYTFGHATCKKKWVEVGQRCRSSRSSFEA